VSHPYLLRSPSCPSSPSFFLSSKSLSLIVLLSFFHPFTPSFFSLSGTLLP
jgi:hypothetical protein